jgi:hypothetical protein
MRILRIVIVLANGPMGQGDNGIAATPPRSSCEAVLEAQLPTPDTMVVRIREMQCHSVKLVIVGPAQRMTSTSAWWFSTAYQVPVVVENASNVPITLPIAMIVDSAVAVQRGRQLNAIYSRRYVDFPFWEGREPQQPWRFVAGRKGGTRLLPGAQTGAQHLTIGSWPLTQGFRVWLRIEGTFPEPRQRAATPAPARPKADTTPVGPVILQFVAAFRFPLQRAIRTLYRDTTRDLVIFDVVYGHAQDCLAGCFYSNAIGMAYGRKLGWLHLYDYENEGLAGTSSRVNHALLRIDESDSYLLSGQLLDALDPTFGGESPLVDQVVLPMTVESPHVYRALVFRLIGDLYAHVNQPRASLLVRTPKVQGDPELLTLMAGLPDPTYETVRDAARRTLHGMGRAVAADRDASTRALFVLAQTLQLPVDSGLRRALLHHRRVRDNPAILAILGDQPQLLAAVQASERVRSMLADYLMPRRRWVQADSSYGWALLADSEAGQNQDVLLVLANLPISVDQGIVWAASRRLPEGSLRRWEPDYIPMP